VLAAAGKPHDFPGFGIQWLDEPKYHFNPPKFTHPDSIQTLSTLFKFFFQVLLVAPYVWLYLKVKMSVF
jgi:hypothetical protein